MLRQQTILKIKYERYTFGLLRHMADLPLSNPYYIHLSSNRLRSLYSEAFYFSKQWLEHGKVLWTSRDKLSFTYSERLANHQWSKLYRYIRSFLKDHHVYGYLLTVNPKKLQYRDVSHLNRKIVRSLKVNSNVAFIKKDVEDNFINSIDNPHFHYLIVALRPLNRRKLQRQAKKYARYVTKGKTQTQVSVVNNWRHATSYVTKQYGLPLPLKHRTLANGKRSKLNQFQEFVRLPLKDQMRLLHTWIAQSKGVERHRLYVNSHCRIASEFHKKMLDKRYCHQHNVLVNASKVHCQPSLNVFGMSDHKLIKKLYPRAQDIVSKHHYSEREQLMQLLHHNIYYHESYKHDVQLSLFNKDSQGSNHHQMKSLKLHEAKIKV